MRKITIDSNRFNRWTFGTLAAAALFVMLFGFGRIAEAQTRRSVFQSGEQLVYKVKFGFIKLGTLVIKTDGAAGGNNIGARMQFWTADVPFLDTHDNITDVIDTHAVHLMRFEEHQRNGDKKTNKSFIYDPGAKTLSYSDDKVTGEVTNNVNPFNDALSLFFNLRTWSASGQSYSFAMRGKDGEKTVAAHFTNREENQETPGTGDDAIKTRIVEGQAAMGSSSPLGANGKFTMYVTEDAAAIPVRIDMSIAVGSISIVLDKVTRSGWTP
jgi:hypothetical protein